MGMMSELGPIDPQIRGYPALALGNSLTLLTELAAKYPGSSPMLADYLSNKLRLDDLGYFERVSESSAQYAERLMRDKTLPQGKTAEGVAKQFVYHYKDHSFVIDIDEATELLGTSVIRGNTPEYAFANDVYKCLSNLDLFFGVARNKHVSLLGELGTKITLRDKPKTK